MSCFVFAIIPAMFEALNFQELGNKGLELATFYGGRILLALVVWVIGSILITYVLRGVMLAIEKSHMDQTLRVFINSIISTLLRVLLFVAAISILGIETTSLVALIGAAGFAIGLALQGSFSNFAGGALILFFKPFVVGDRIEAGGYSGVVEEIQIFNTILRTLDSKQVIVPNGELSNNPIINVTGNNIVGIELTFGIGYEDNVEKAKEIITQIITTHPDILKDPAPVIGLSELADSSINFFTRSFVKPEHYWDVTFSLNEQVKKAFDKEKISIPYPQRDIHLYNHNQ